MEGIHKIRYRVSVKVTKNKVINLGTVLALGICNLEQYRYFGMEGKGGIGGLGVILNLVDVTLTTDGFSSG
jgi:hypothetical protein